MKLYLENIGMLKSAEITLHPLTVIAGENDNGKSTVGKVVFCIVKAVNRYKEDLSETKEYWINEKLDELYFLVRGAAKKTSSVSEALLTLLHPDRSYHAPSDFVANIIDGCAAWLNAEEVAEDTRQKVQSYCNDLLDIVNSVEDKKNTIENAFNKVFAAEFDASLLLQGAEKGCIKLFDGHLELLHLEVSDDNTVRLVNDVEPIILKDATFIETPLLLNYHDLLIRSQTMLGVDKRTVEQIGIPYTTLHTKDLFDKLIMRASIFQKPEKNNELILDHILELIGGDISYDPQGKDFVFTRDDQKISIKNTASGIKTFGLLRILLRNTSLNKNSILIFDEPENHLHPKWQLKLAKLLVAMSKNGIQILVSSHSPYMIEALKRYSELPESRVETGFYLAEERAITDKDRLADIFEILAEPFNVFREMDAEALKDE